MNEPNSDLNESDELNRRKLFSLMENVSEKNRGQSGEGIEKAIDQAVGEVRRKKRKTRKSG